jgi:AcrR family transcriptional regulator
MSKKRMAPEARKDVILAVACRLAAAGTHYERLTRDQIAAAAGITGSAVQYHFKTVAQLQRAIMRHAVATGALAVIAQGMASRDPHAMRAPHEMRVAAIKCLTLND